MSSSAKLTTSPGPLIGTGSTVSRLLILCLSSSVKDKACLTLLSTGLSGIVLNFRGDLAGLPIFCFLEDDFRGLILFRLGDSFLASFSTLASKSLSTTRKSHADKLNSSNEEEMSRSLILTVSTLLDCFWPSPSIPPKLDFRLEDALSITD